MAGRFTCICREFAGAERSVRLNQLAAFATNLQPAYPPMMARGRLPSSFCGPGSQGYQNILLLLYQQSSFHAAGAATPAQILAYNKSPVHGSHGEMPAGACPG